MSELMVSDTENHVYISAFGRISHYELGAERAFDGLTRIPVANIYAATHIDGMLYIHLRSGKRVLIKDQKDWHDIIGQAGLYICAHSGDYVAFDLKSPCSCYGCQMKRKENGRA